MNNARVVLMIEDDVDIRELLATRVRRLGVEVVTATTGATGIQTAREIKPDLLVVDIGLPDMDGWAVIEQLADDDRTRDIPVVVASIVDPVEGVSQRVEAHLVKPIKKGALEDAVMEAIQKGDS
ncbi:MAG TPA: response regulator [Acidimicrobiales bacterium]|nr:response regulator [Acidimicrobiales bacterium]